MPLNRKDPSVKRSFGTGSDTPPGEEPVVVAVTTEAVPPAAGGGGGGDYRPTVGTFLKEYNDKGDAAVRAYLGNDYEDRRLIATLNEIAGVPSVGVTNADGKFVPFVVNRGESVADAALNYSKLLMKQKAGGDQATADAALQQMVAQQMERGFADEAAALAEVERLARMNKEITARVGRGFRLKHSEDVAKLLSNNPELFQVLVDNGMLKIPGGTGVAPSAAPPTAPAPTTPVPNGGTTDWWAESAPFLEDYGITRGQAAWGAGGITAAGLGLAAMLANSGQPQIDPAAYAAYQQSVNSY